MIISLTTLCLLVSTIPLFSFEEQSQERARDRKVPLICNKDNRLRVEKIEFDYKCSRFLDIANTSSADIPRKRVVLWHKNTFKHAQPVAACRIHVVRRWMKHTFDVWKGIKTIWGGRSGTDFQNVYRHEEEWDEEVTEAACRIMDSDLQHEKYGTLTQVDTIFDPDNPLEHNINVMATENEKNIPEPELIKIYGWVYADTRDAYLERGVMLTDPVTKQMYSTLNGMTTCTEYLKGFCKLGNNKTMVWRARKKVVAKYKLWTVKDFYESQNTLLSVDHRLGLTGFDTNKVATVQAHVCLEKNKEDQNDCPLKTYHVFGSDQGVLLTITKPDIGTLADDEADDLTERDPETARFIREAHEVRKQRKRTARCAAPQEERAGEGDSRCARAAHPFKADPVSAAQFAAGTQAALHLRMLAAQRALHYVAHHICVTTELASRYLLSATADGDAATMFVRKMFGKDNIMGEISGHYVSVYGCTPMSEYIVLPMNQTCSHNLPMRFKYRKIWRESYMNPMTRIITGNANPCDCSKALEILVDLEDGPFTRLKPPLIIHGPTGKPFEVNAAPVLLGPLWSKESIEMQDVIVAQFSGVDIRKYLVKITAEDYYQYSFKYKKFLADIEKEAAVAAERAREELGQSGFNALVDDAGNLVNGVILDLNPVKFISQLFNCGLFSTIFFWFWNAVSPLFAIWQWLCCIAVTVQILTTFVIPFVVKTLFTYKDGGHVFNAGDNATQAYKKIAQLRKKKKKPDDDESGLGDNGDPKRPINNNQDGPAEGEEVNSEEFSEYDDEERN